MSDIITLDGKDAENIDFESKKGINDVGGNHKNRLCRFIFGNLERNAWTLDLYNAVNGSSYTGPYNLFSSRQQKAPAPKCVCFYNRLSDKPDETVVSLKDSFSPDSGPDIEVRVRIINMRVYLNN